MQTFVKRPVLLVNTCQMAVVTTIEKQLALNETLLTACDLSQHAATPHGSIGSHSLNEND